MSPYHPPGTDGMEVIGKPGRHRDLTEEQAENLKKALGEELYKWIEEVIDHGRL